MTRWRKITTPRTATVFCSACHRDTINEYNRLRRDGWQESEKAPRRYRCGRCAEAAS